METIEIIQHCISVFIGLAGGWILGYHFAKMRFMVDKMSAMMKLLTKAMDTINNPNSKHTKEEVLREFEDFKIP